LQLKRFALPVAVERDVVVMMACVSSEDGRFDGALSGASIRRFGIMTF
jgi:hypothetical protein